MADKVKNSAVAGLKAKLASGGDKLAGWALLAPGEIGAAAARARPSTLTWIAILLGAVILLSVNIISASIFKNTNADLTASSLYTLSDGTRRVLAKIDEPIDVKVYFSDRLGEVSALHKRYFSRVRALFERYQSITSGFLRVQFIDPKPFSDAEDRAVAAGLTGIQLGTGGENGYFGLVATNSTDNRETVPFFAPQREAYLEYDMTKLVLKLAAPKKPVIGLISGIPINGGMTPRGQQMPAWAIMSQLRDFFNVEDLTQSVAEIPAKVDVVMLVNPIAIGADTAYAIDQFVLRGGRLLAFLDPVSEIGAMANPMLRVGGKSNPELDKLLAAWGVKFDAKNVVGDTENARRVQAGGATGLISDYVAWHEVTAKSLAQGEVIGDGIKIMNIATPGHFEPIEGATTKLQPIVSTSKNAALLDAVNFAGQPDPVGLLKDYKPGGKVLTLAARLTGDIKTAFPDGKPKDKADAKDAKSNAGAAPSAAAASQAGKSEKAGKPVPALKSGKINAVLVADSDMLYDEFWVTVREVFGQRLMMPMAHNAAFAMNALENLSGGEALSGLRSRGVDNRPFVLVEQIRRESELKYRKSEQGLMAKLEGLQQRLEKVTQTTGKDGQISLALSEQDKQAVEEAREDMIKTRRELRNVKHALRADIETLEGWVKFINIALVPLLIAAGGFAFTSFRRRTAGKA